MAAGMMSGAPIDVFLQQAVQEEDMPSAAVRKLYHDLACDKAGSTTWYMLKNQEREAALAAMATQRAALGALQASSVGYQAFIDPNTGRARTSKELCDRLHAMLVAPPEEKEGQEASRLAQQVASIRNWAPLATTVGGPVLAFATGYSNVLTAAAVGALSMALRSETFAKWWEGESKHINYSNGMRQGTARDVAKWRNWLKDVDTEVLRLQEEAEAKSSTSDPHAERRRRPELHRQLMAIFHDHGRDSSWKASVQWRWVALKYAELLQNYQQSTQTAEKRVALTRDFNVVQQPAIFYGTAAVIDSRGYLRSMDDAAWVFIVNYHAARKAANSLTPEELAQGQAAAEALRKATKEEEEEEPTEEEEEEEQAKEAGGNARPARPPP